VNVRTVLLAPGAREDFRAAFLWYQERNRAAAENFRATVHAAIDNLAVTAIHPAADDEAIASAP
jgi:plasmid stabilization system protein ParE